MLTLFDSDKSRCTAYVPKRLPRADVGALRMLYHRAFSVMPSDLSDKVGVAKHPWSTKLTIYVTRDRRERSLARLRGGQDHARVELTVEWYKIEALGLNVTVWAYSPHKYGENSVKVGEHRFRPTTTVTEFCRQLSMLVRHGIGWSREQNARLGRIL